jgi:hypothetical protein
MISDKALSPPRPKKCKVSLTIQMSLFYYRQTQHILHTFVDIALSFI